MELVRLGEVDLPRIRGVLGYALGFFELSCAFDNTKSNLFRNKGNHPRR